MARAPNADVPPLIPVGYDAYRRWELWPCQRFGVRAYLRSTYDRTGHNRTADASHYLYGLADDFHVTLDVEGQGVLYFARSNRWHGSPWHYEIDDVDHIVEETSTADPLHPGDPATFVPAAAFPPPLAYTFTTTQGADLSWVPMPFQRRLRLAHSRTYYGTGYYIYHLLAEPSGLPPWTPASRPDQDVLALLERAGGDPVAAQGLTERHGRFQLAQDSQVTLQSVVDGPAMVRRLTLSAPAQRARDLGAARLIVTWDGRAAASVDAPLALFHGAGTLYNPDGRDCLVEAFPVSVRFHDERVHLACYLPMPYFASARFEVAAGHRGEPIADVRWSLATEPYPGPWNHVGYLHATYRDHGVPRFGQDLEFLDTAGIEGSAAWSGSLIGTSFVFTDRNVLTTLEGDPRFFFDDSRTPQVQGTGTEEWGGGGDYWGGRTMSLPLAGHPTGIADAESATHPDQLVHSAYRFLLADLMPFGRRARICFEHGGENESAEHYRSVTYWYGLPGASLVLTDSLDIGDPASEAAHAYHSPDATPPYTLRSRYEWGPDHLPIALGGPLADPVDYVDVAFPAPAGVYHVWLEAVIGAELFDAALWLQFNDDIGCGRLDPSYMGSMGFLNAGRAPGRYGFTTGTPPVSSVRLPDGAQRLRLQPRHGRMQFRRILLSRDQARRPGADFVSGPNDIVLGPEQVQALGGGFEFVADRSGGRAIELRRAPAEVEIHPEQKMTGRRTLTASELTLRIEADNHGVLLRRTLDYGYANQRAEVFVEQDGRWCAAGTWYLAGSNTVYHSFPWLDGELADPQPVVITSNRRFRDDEFLLPARLTRGQERLRLRLRFAPRNPPLLPGLEPAPTAWTEFAYHAYSYVMPTVELSASGVPQTIQADRHDDH